MNGNQFFAQSAIPHTGNGYAPQFVPQGLFASPFGGVSGPGFGVPFANPTLPRPFGAIGGGFVPFSVDPVTTALGLQVTTHVVSQTPLATQGFTGQTAGQPLVWQSHLWLLPWICRRTSGRVYAVHG